MCHYLKKILLFTLSCVLLAGCSAAPKKLPSDSQNPPTTQDGEQDRTTAQDGETDMTGPDLTGDGTGSRDELPDSYVYVLPECIFPVSEIPDDDGVAWELLNCEVTKEFGERNMENLNYFWDDNGIDSNGNLVKDCSYIFLSLQYTNTTDSKVKIFRPGKGIYFLDANNIFCDRSETNYIDVHWTGGTVSEVLFYELAPGETITSEVGYIVEDGTLEKYDKIYLAIRQADCWTDAGGATDPNAIFVDLSGLIKP